MLERILYRLAIPMKKSRIDEESRSQKWLYNQDWKRCILMQIRLLVCIKAQTWSMEPCLDWVPHLDSVNQIPELSQI
jgi:hypothetical protein